VNQRSKEMTLQYKISSVNSHLVVHNGPNNLPCYWAFSFFIWCASNGSAVFRTFVSREKPRAACILHCRSSKMFPVRTTYRRPDLRPGPVPRHRLVGEKTPFVFVCWLAIAGHVVHHPCTLYSDVSCSPCEWPQLGLRARLLYSQESCGGC